jgi:pseudouridine-5'-monophosphatase
MVSPLRAGADTEGFYTTMQEKILERYGKVFDWSVKAKMMGKTTAESTRILFEEFDLSRLLTPEQFLEEREIMLQMLLPTCVAMPGEQDVSASATTTSLF